MLDYIIVGLGLGGATTAFHLEERGRSFMAFEDGSMSSSKVAGGVMNPVILKRFTLAWKADEQLHSSKEFYKRMEEHLGYKFYSPVEIYRKFSSAEEQNNWFSAADKPHLSPFLDTSLKSDLSAALPSQYSFGRVLQTGRVDTRKLLDTYVDHLVERGKLIRSRFEYNDLQIKKDHVVYGKISARRIIFCEGFGILRNPFFSYLPMVGNKGEYIIIKAPDLKLRVSVKSSVFISPIGKDLYAVGATYNNRDKTPNATTEARLELIHKLEKMINVSYEVVDQVVGIRPSTVDRRPLVGQHPKIQNFFCCNGFGSRGVLIAPAASAELLNFIENSEPLSPEIDLSRFTRKHFKN